LDFIESDLNVQKYENLLRNKVVLAITAIVNKTLKTRGSNRMMHHLLWTRRSWLLRNSFSCSM